MGRRFVFWLALSGVLTLSRPGVAAQFTDLGPSLGLPDTTGAAWGDYNRDGAPDLFLSSNHLLENRGASGFADVTGVRGIPSAGLPQYGVAWADYDNDGDLDLFVACDGSASRLYRCEPLRFSNVASEAGLTRTGPARGAAWCDYDGDNWLDLFVCYQDEAGGCLYHNQGFGSFVEVTESAGFWAGEPPTDAIACAWGDLDNDTYPDLLVTRAGARPCLYRNQQNGTFVEVGLSAGLAAVSDALGAAWGDYDNDGFLDLYLTSAQARRDWLLRNNGDGTFSDVAASAGMAGDASAGAGVVWLDYDNDGHLDLYVGNTEPGNQPFLYHNNGDGTFTETAAAAGVGGSRVNQVACWADPDSNGDADLFSGVLGAGSSLFDNQGTAGSHLLVRAITDADGNATDMDTSDDRDAIGAFVEVNLDNDIRFPPGRTVVRMIDGGSGLWGQSQMLAHFGVSDSVRVAARVFFPDGTVVGHNDIPVNQTFTIYDVSPPGSAARLYAGTRDPAMVYAYGGGTSWALISEELGLSVNCLIQYQGHLYAGTTSPVGKGQVYRDEGGGLWTQVGADFGSDVTALEVYQGSLYAGTAWTGMALYRLDGPSTWTQVAYEPEGWGGVGALYSASTGLLEVGDIAYDVFGHFDGAAFTTDESWGGCCVYDYADYQGAVFAGAWVGKLYRSSDGLHWEGYPGFLPCIQILELQPFRGYLYTGSDNGGVGALFARTRWPSPAEVVWASDNSIEAMVADADRAIYFGGRTPEHAGVVYCYVGAGAPACIGASLAGGVTALHFWGPFSDVRSDFWAVDYIAACVDGGIVAGYADDTYRPFNQVDRAAMAVFVSRGVAGSDAAVPPGPSTPTFQDVPTDHWAYRHVEYAYSQGIVQGYGSEYRPAEKVNRAQMAVFIARAMAGGDGNVPDPGCTTPPFTDIPCDFWARKYVQYVKDAGVAAGYSDGTYRPTRIVNRGEMAVYVARAFDLL